LNIYTVKAYVGWIVALGGREGKGCGGGGRGRDFPRGQRKHYIFFSS
jgi:hypothetical protein